VSGSANVVVSEPSSLLLGGVAAGVLMVVSNAGRKRRTATA
jgi:hypothetical protein